MTNETKTRLVKDDLLCKSTGKDIIIYINISDFYNNVETASITYH